MREYRIRYGTPADNRLLAEMGRTAFADSFGADNTPENMAAYLDASFSPQIQAEELADPNSLFLIAESEGQPVGFARMKEGDPPEVITGARPIEIVRFYALKEWIGQGVGAALMSACLDEANKRGCDAIWLDVWEKNERAIRFYRKWGFEVVGEQSFQLGADIQRDLLMQRNL